MEEEQDIAGDNAVADQEETPAATAPVVPKLKIEDLDEAIEKPSQYVLDMYGTIDNPDNLFDK